jgi:crossover junction endodeoxyribonuclease RuvC
MKNNRRVIGIDPGLSCTAFFIIDMENAEESIYDELQNKVLENNILVNHGYIKPKNKIDRLLNIYNFVERAILEYNPDVMVIETSYININPSTSITFAYVRALCILCAEKYKLELYEFSPLTIKKNVTGNGHATKEDIARKLSIFGNYNEHVTDALAICLNYKFSRMSVPKKKKKKKILM